MTQQKPLSEPELSSALRELPGWSVQYEKLHREYQFPDFSYAFGFMATAATRIEQLNHHPEWSNIYNRVTIDLTTHDAGGITRADVDLAMFLESIAVKLR